MPIYFSRIHSALLARLTECGWLDELRAASASASSNTSSTNTGMLALPGSGPKTDMPNPSFREIMAVVNDTAQGTTNLSRLGSDSNCVFYSRYSASCQDRDLEHDTWFRGEAVRMSIGNAIRVLFQQVRCLADRLNDSNVFI